MTELQPKSRGTLAKETLTGAVLLVGGLAVVGVVAWSGHEDGKFLIVAGTGLASFGGFIVNKKLAGEFFGHALAFVRVWKWGNGK
jgi:hypothetical protein